jgi:hypothetical protein
MATQVFQAEPVSSLTSGKHAAISSTLRKRSNTRPVAAARAPISVSWNFGKIPVFQRDAADLRDLSQIHPKLKVGAVDDPMEREADRIAEHVMRMPGQAFSVTGARPQLSRKCAACEEEDKVQRLRMKSASAFENSAVAPAIVHEVLGSPGQPLDSSVRGFFEPRFGYNFSRVRVHSDSRAAESAQAVKARAYIVGNHLVLGSSQYDKALLAHELAHVVQQQGQPGIAVRRQEKTIGGPLDLKPNPCITAPVVGTLCGQDAVGACEKLPSLPGCGIVCKIFGCAKPSEPKTVCPTGFHSATSPDLKGQCCTGAVDDKQSCCTPDRIGPIDFRCCANDEVVVDNRCKKSSDISPLPPGRELCLPWQRTVTGKCCIPPMVPKGAQCVMPEPETPKGPIGPTGPQLGIRWTDEIHFEQDRPGRGGGPALTSQGEKELDSVLSWLRLSSDLEVRLIGNASFEGPPTGREEYNQALAARRVQFVIARLGSFSARVADPILGDGAESGCQKLGPGKWGCGSKDAPANTARPEDRVVRVTFARNKLPQLSLPPLTVH